MRRFFRIVLALVLLSLVGCDSSSPDPVAQAPAAPAPATLTMVQVPVDAEGGGTAASGLGHEVVFPADVLTQDTTVTLTVLGQPPFQPVDPDFEAVGPYLHVDLGTAAASGNVQFAIPYPADDAPNAYVQVDVGDGIYLPLPSNYDANAGVLRASFNPSSLAAVVPARTVGRFAFDSFVVGAGDSDDYDNRPVHQNWPSWNAYQFVDGTFQLVYNQGNAVTSFQALGTRPVVLVHGLGSSIRGGRFDDLASTLMAKGGFTSVLAFEYDTLNSAATSGGMLKQFYGVLHTAAPNVSWHHLSHSMGCLVSRQAFEQGGQLPYTNGNSAVLVAGPHAGSPIINAIQAQANLFDPGMKLVIQNGYMDFANADGTLCRPQITDQGFNDLAVDSGFLTTLNMNAPNNHPKEVYRTIAGTTPGQLGLLAWLLGVKPTPDDGVVPLASANANFIGAVDSAAVPDDHVEILDDAKNGQAQILLFLSAQ